MLDFSSELDQGYSHMRDDDPRSINDDFVRSFTISSPPPPADESRGSTFTLTLRKIANGPVTSHLFRHGLKSNRTTAAPFEIPILGFSGSFRFDVPKARKLKHDEQAKLVYVCSGVGITPLLAQMDELAKADDLLESLSVFWTVGVQDVAFVVDTLATMSVFKRVGMRLRVFVTGIDNDGSTSTFTKQEQEADIHETLQKLEEHDDIQILRRRFQEDDFATIFGQQVNENAETETKRQVLICANPKITTIVREWMHKLDVEVLSEDFAY